MTEKKKNYLSNKNLMQWIIESKVTGQPNDALALAFIQLAERYSRRSNFMFYTYRDEMVSDAILTLVINWHKFDETRFNNPFSYFTQIVHNSFVQYLNKEKRQTDVKNALLINNGMDTMGFGVIDLDDGDPSEVYDSRHEVETLEPEPVVATEEDDMV